MVVSHSELACFRRCPREHQYRFVDNRQPVLDAKALVTGRRVHAALAGEPMPADAPPGERAMVAGHAARWRQASSFTIDKNEVPFEVEIAGVRVAGTMDGIATETASGRKIIIERKTTSQDISPGSAYWRRIIHIDAQVSTYLYAGRALSLDPKYVFYDVLRKPALRQKKGETEDQFFERIVSDMAERPDFYFQRAVIVRLQDEHENFARDVSGTVHLMQATLRPAPRNVDACYSWGRECDFFGVCAGEVSLDDDTRFTARTYRSNEVQT